MINNSQILDQFGKPMMGSVGSNYSNLNKSAKKLECWNPPLQSADAEILPDLDVVKAKAKELVREHSNAVAAREAHIDNIVGCGLKLSAKPIGKLLGLDNKQVSDISQALEREFTLWAEDTNHNCDQSKQSDFHGLQNQAYDTFFNTGDVLAVAHYYKERGRYATCIQMIDPDRLQTPPDVPRGKNIRGGIEFNKRNEVVAYYIRNKHPNDNYDGRYHYSKPSDYEYKRVPKYTKTGRLRVIHIFDKRRAGQSRGYPLWISTLDRLKKQGLYQNAELSTAIIQTSFGTVLESPLPTVEAQKAFGAPNPIVNKSSYSDAVKEHLLLQNEYHKDANALTINDSELLHLLPGEKLHLLQGAIKEGFLDFETVMLRSIAAGTGCTYEQISKDYSQVNYSSARAAMLEAWKGYKRRRKQIVAKFCNICYQLVLEEALSKNYVKIPKNTPSFKQAKTAWSKAKWIGEGKGFIDALKERKAQALAYRMGILSLDDIASQEGNDWQEIIRQRKIEQDYAAELGIDINSLIYSESREDSEVVDD